MHKFRSFIYLGAIAVCLVVCLTNPSWIAFLSLFILLSALGITPRYQTGAECVTFDDLATATEALQNKVIQRAFNNNMWLNAVPRGTYPKGTGVTQTTFTMNHSEPDDTDALGDEITLDGSGNPVSGDDDAKCPNDYPEVGVGYFRRTYGPRRLKWRGPIICKDELTYRHNVIQFLNGYETMLIRNAQRRIEFASRANYIKLVGAFSDGVFYEGPDAIDDVVVPTSDLTQGQLDIAANYLIDIGAAEPDSTGFIMLGESGPLFTLEISDMASGRILKNNDDRRQDARWAMANELWKRIGASRIIGNFRHVPTTMPIRGVNVGGVITPVRTFRTASEMNAAGRRFTAAYDAANYEAAIVIIPQVMTFEMVMPENYKYSHHQSYMGELSFIEGGERIQAGCFDPEHLLAAFFGRLDYAAAPVDPALGCVIWYKRPALDVAASDIYSYPGAQ